ncbi:hypothetical protein ET445_00835 [Agromyces protaetiae]|uniref:AbiEi antitoxin N-terminal domain-containing protein n=1 Tax=Agromyces protaetiae TaxID=2509455 RepID=A0A4V0YGR1_9MICO|nr:type IV toxin-antitoxin system AbiEi family antitoxin domain-containing protein [Agromyces protaetiae]QAY72091.1 hypothetical protein ET445_00835 [Agromyces protaetiae]
MFEERGLRGIRRSRGATMARMDPYDLAETQGRGIMRAAVLRELGVHPRELAKRVQRGDLVRVRSGAYVRRALWDAAGPDERYRLRIGGAVLAARHPVTLSHVSAAAWHGLPIIGRRPDAVHLVDTDRSGGRRTPQVVVHRAGPEPEPVVIDGVRCTSLVRTLVDVAATEPFARAVAMIDAALARGITVESLLAELDLIAPARGHRMAQAAIEFGDGRSGSAGESLSRAQIHLLGFVAPELQVRFDGILGSYALVDFYWRALRLIGEFDGRIKYSRSLDLSGRDTAAVLFDEKRREDALRRLGERVARWDWTVANTPRELFALLSEFGVPRR